MNDIPIIPSSSSCSTIMAFPPSHSFMFQTHHEDHHHHHHHELHLRSTSSPSLNNNNSSFPSLPPQHFQGASPASFMMKRSMSFSGIETNKQCEESLHGVDDDLSDDGSQIGELKKKRLNLEQVKALEKSFELGNKLEPERKMQLAKALGLQPRQIAIWFQNRRARWKTKQLEKEYEVLKKQFEAVKADNHNLKNQNQKLHAELQALKNRECCETGTIISLKKETEGSWSNNGSDNSSDINLDLSRTPVMNTSPVSSSHHHHPNNNNNNNIDNNNNIGKNLLPNSLKPNSITQLLQCSSSSRSDNLQDESFCNMFHNIDESHNFWPWPTTEQHHFH